MRATIVCGYRTADGDEREVERKEGVEVRLGRHPFDLPLHSGSERSSPPQARGWSLSLCSWKTLWPP